MGASVRTEDEAFSDERYADLARAAGLADSDHARGKMGRLWRQCTIECTYVLPRETVVSVLGDHGVEALVLSRLGELVDGGVRIRGTKGRVEWLKKLRRNGKFGKRGGRPKRNPDGLPNKPIRVTKSAPNLTPPTPTPTPAPAPTDPEKSSPSRKRSGAPTPGHGATIADFSRRFEAAYQTKPTWDAKRAKQAKALLTSHGEPEVRRRIALLFSGGLAWPHPPYDFDTFVKHFDKIGAPTTGHRARDPTVGRVEPQEPNAYPTGDLDL